MADARDSLAQRNWSDFADGLRAALAARLDGLNDMGGEDLMHFADAAMTAFWIQKHALLLDKYVELGQAKFSD